MERGGHVAFQLKRPPWVWRPETPPQLLCRHKFGSIHMIYQSAYSQFRSTGSRQDRFMKNASVMLIGPGAGKIDHCQGAMYAELTGVMQVLLLAGDAGMDGVVVEES
ncbi:hypothetical protein EJB05_52356, partial [Eragrostis curvula]